MSLVNTAAVVYNTFLVHECNVCVCVHANKNVTASLLLLSLLSKGAIVDSAAVSSKTRGNCPIPRMKALLSPRCIETINVRSSSTVLRSSRLYSSWKTEG